MWFKRFKTFVFDLDGTIWDWKRLYPGVKEKLKELKEKGRQTIFTTNNTLLSQNGTLEKLRGFGIEVDKPQLITAGLCIRFYLDKKSGKVLAFGKGLIEDLKLGVMKLTNSPDECRYIAIGHDRNFSLESLTLASEALARGAILLATTRDSKWVCGNKPIPSTGVIVRVIEKYSGKRAKILGKTSDFFAKLLYNRVTSPRNEAIVIGDGVADFTLAKKLNYKFALVLTGLGKEFRMKPDFTLGSVAEIEI